LSGEVVCCVLDSVDSVADSFLDRYGCVEGYSIQAAGVWSCLVVVLVELSVLYASNEFEAVFEMCWDVPERGPKGSGK